MTADQLIPVAKPTIGEQELALVTDAVRSGWVSSIGKYIEEFERAFARYCGTRYAVATSNGTTGLHLALLSAGIKPGDEVIIPDLTFIATINSVLYTGATPVVVDVDPETLCIAPEAIRAALTPRTKAIMPVHLYGHPADMGAIAEIAQSRDIAVIEDAAEAHGAEYSGRRVGSLGACGVFSFYGNKIITTGEGGMITTDSEALYRRARMLRDHAMDPARRYWHGELGYNYRMTNIQAALGLAQMGRIEGFAEKKRTIMQWYREGLEGTPRVRLNRCAPWARNVYWMVCVEVEGLAAGGRDEVARRLRELGVDSRPYFHPVSDMPYVARANTPVSHHYAAIGLNLPSFVDLTHEEVAAVCRKLKTVLHQL